MPRAPKVPRPAPPAHAAGELGVNRRLRRWLAAELRALRPALAVSAARCEADRYRKHFDAFAHACVLLFHGLAASPSLRVSYAAFAGCDGLVALSGLAPPAGAAGLGVSFSQLAASSTSRPAAFLAGLVPGLAARVRAAGRPPGGAPPADLRIVDATVLRLGLKLAPWLPPTARKAPGVKVQVAYAPALDLPEHAVTTDRHTPDCVGLDHLILDDPARLAGLAGQPAALDLGYYSHARFARLLAAGAHFVTRLHPQATVVVEEERPVQAALPALGPGRIAVAADQRVTVGSANNRRGEVLPGLRLVTATVAPQARAAQRGAAPVEYRVLTDRWDLDAAEAVQLYVWRWEIELLFRWLKRHVKLGRLLGYSRNAVELTVWLAIVVHLLTLLAARALGLGRRTPALLWQLAWALAQALPGLEPEPAPPPARQLALPGWRSAPAPPPPRR